MEKLTAWTDKGEDCAAQLDAAGIVIERRTDGLYCNNPVLADQIAGAFDPFPYAKTRKQAALDKLLYDNFDFVKFIRAGSSTSITGNNIGNFLATITNNYRTKRAAITAATTQADLDAVNLATGWPNNP